MLSHKGILPFKCNICSYKTNKKHVLMRHYTIHTGEKPHKCPICSFGSLDHVELLKHMNVSLSIQLLYAHLNMIQKQISGAEDHLVKLTSLLIFFCCIN